MRFPRLAQNQAERRGGGGGCVQQRVDPEALQKITQLESELLKLRAQIAMIVTAAPSSGTFEIFLQTKHSKNNDLNEPFLTFQL